MGAHGSYEGWLQGGREIVHFAKESEINTKPN